MLNADHAIAAALLATCRPTPNGLRQQNDVFFGADEPKEKSNWIMTVRARSGLHSCASMGLRRPFFDKTSQRRR